MNPTTCFPSNVAIDALIDSYGAKLEAIEPMHKCMMVSAFADHIARHNEWDMWQTLNSVDPDGLMGDALIEAIVQISDESDVKELANFNLALSAQIFYHAGQGELL